MSRSTSGTIGVSPHFAAGYFLSSEATGIEIMSVSESIGLLNDPDTPTSYQKS